MTDANAHGGAIQSGCATVMIEGQPAARKGDLSTCPKCGPGKISNHSSTINIGGAPAAGVGHDCACASPSKCAVGVPGTCGPDTVKVVREEGESWIEKGPDGYPTKMTMTDGQPVADMNYVDTQSEYINKTSLSHSGENSKYSFDATTTSNEHGVTVNSVHAHAQPYNVSEQTTSQTLWGETTITQDINVGEVDINYDRAGNINATATGVDGHYSAEVLNGYGTRTEFSADIRLGVAEGGSFNDGTVVGTGGEVAGSKVGISASFERPLFNHHDPVVLTGDAAVDQKAIQNAYIAEELGTAPGSGILDIDASSVKSALEFVGFAKETASDIAASTFKFDIQKVFTWGSKGPGNYDVVANTNDGRIEAGQHSLLPVNTVVSWGKPTKEASKDGSSGGGGSTVMVKGAANVNID